jgi:hypothetical protein
MVFGDGNDTSRATVSAFLGDGHNTAAFRSLRFGDSDVLTLARLSSLSNSSGSNGGNRDGSSSSSACGLGQSHGAGAACSCTFGHSGRVGNCLGASLHGSTARLCHRDCDSRARTTNIGAGAKILLRQGIALDERCPASVDECQRGCQEGSCGSGDLHCNGWVFR